MYRLFDGPPPRGLVQLVISLLASGYIFFFHDGRFGSSRPTFFEQFQTGIPNDFAVLVGLGLIIWIGFSIAVVIADYRSSGRWW